ncbi:MAG: hypothetical protein NC110_02625 [Ruminococcus sp.]|nr:hypothetical protein [Ruminococcus sp.]
MSKGKKTALTIAISIFMFVATSEGIILYFQAKEFKEDYRILQEYFDKQYQAFEVEHSYDPAELTDDTIVLSIKYKNHIYNATYIEGDFIPAFEIEDKELSDIKYGTFRERLREPRCVSGYKGDKERMMLYCGELYQSTGPYVLYRDDFVFPKITPENIKSILIKENEWDDSPFEITDEEQIRAALQRYQKKERTVITTDDLAEFKDEMLARLDKDKSEYDINYNEYDIYFTFKDCPLVNYKCDTSIYLHREPLHPDGLFEIY